MSWIGELWMKAVMRPLGKMVGTSRYEPHLTLKERCVECGHRQIGVILASTPCWDPETEAVWGTECGECGAMACTSFGESIEDPVRPREF